MNSFLGSDLRAFGRWIGLALAVYALVPFMWGLFMTSPGELYLPYQTNFDDHMVYAAWMRQAQDFHFLFDNRFTTDRQPGLTIHVYFFALGLISKVIGIPWTTMLAKAVFSFLFVGLLAQLVDLTSLNLRSKKLGIVFGTFGAGLAPLSWQSFGVAYTDPSRPLAALSSLRLPIDVWQPEAFVFSSALTNGLFMASLCLILVIFLSALKAQESWKPVLPGALAMLVLMNIHSYDVLLVTAVLVGTLASVVGVNRFDLRWATRCFVIGLGALPSAFWFTYVITNDPVFQHRANTLTWAPSFQQIVVGLLPMIVLGVGGIATWKSKDKTRTLIGLLGLVGVIVLLFVMSQGRDPDRYFLSGAGFAGVFLIMLFVSASLASEDLPSNLILAWAVTGLVLPFYHALFQRKLGMGMALPWGVLAAVGVSKIGAALSQPIRRYALIGITVGICVTPILWLQREIQEINRNVSSTTVHSMLYSKDVAAIIDYLNSHPGRKVVAAPTAIPNLVDDASFPYGTPVMTDLNPVLSGMTGSYTYAGHWSETPSYTKRRELVHAIFFRTQEGADPVELAHQAGISYLVVPNAEAFPRLKLNDLSTAGTVVYQGTQFSLVSVVQ